MKTTLTFIVLLFAQSVALMGQQPDARSILLQSAEALKAHNLYQYDAKYRIKYFDNTDTTAFRTYSCVVQKAPADTILGYYAKVYNNQEERIYDGQNFLMIWHEHKKILRDQPVLSGKKFTRSNISVDHVPTFFYSATPLQSYLDNATELTISSVPFDGRTYWKVEVLFPVNEEITFLKRIVYIDQKSNFPVKVEGFAKFQDIQDEYSELILSNIQGTQIGHSDFSTHYSYPVDYAEEMVKIPKISYDLLAPGSPFVPFVGKDRADRQLSLTAADAENSLVLLDFWYLACAPCLRALPHMVQLHEKYKNRGLQVYGINPIDQPDKRGVEIGKFVDKWKVAYPLVFTDKTVPEKYLVKSYPTLYLIKNGKVLHTSLSMSAEKWQELDRLIEANLE